jgi:DNA uptake protein ComE-like DNA-binding protein
VNLNKASVDVLNRLGGGHIGQAIVAHRPYRSVADLVKKRVVRRSVYEQIKDQVAAY